MLGCTPAVCHCNVCLAPSVCNTSNFSRKEKGWLYRMVILYIIFVSCLATPFRTVSPIINSCSETEDKLQILEVSRGYTWFIAYIVIK